MTDERFQPDSLRAARERSERFYGVLATIWGIAFIPALLFTGKDSVWPRIVAVSILVLWIASIAAAVATRERRAAKGARRDT